MAQPWDLFRGDTYNWEGDHFFLEIILGLGQHVLDVDYRIGWKFVNVIIPRISLLVRESG